MAREALQVELRARPVRRGIDPVRPDPAPFAASHSAPQSSPRAFGWIARGLTTATSGIAARNGAQGCDSTKRTVRASGAVTFSARSTGVKAPAGPRFIASSRRKLYTTSSAVMALPSWNVAPARSVNSQVSPSSETVCRAASQGTSSGGLPWYLYSPSYTLSRMNWLGTSNTARGSSVAGSVSPHTSGRCWACAAMGAAMSAAQASSARRRWRRIGSSPGEVSRAE